MPPSRSFPGPEKRSHVVSDKEKKLTAYHEAGHAHLHLLQRHPGYGAQISIIPRGMAGGYTLSLPTEDRSYRTKREMPRKRSSPCWAAGWPKRLCWTTSPPALPTTWSAPPRLPARWSPAMASATAWARLSTARTRTRSFWAGDLGHTRDYSETVAAQIDEEIRSVIDSAYDQCEATLAEHMDQLHKVAEFLYEFEKINGADFDRLMKGDMSVFEEHRAKAGGKTTPMNPVEQPEQIASNDRQLPDDSSAETPLMRRQDGADRPERPRNRQRSRKPTSRRISPRRTTSRAPHSNKMSERKGDAVLRHLFLVG